MVVKLRTINDQILKIMNSYFYNTNDQDFKLEYSTVLVDKVILVELGHSTYGMCTYNHNIYIICDENQAIFVLCKRSIFVVWIISVDCTCSITVFSIVWDIILLQLSMLITSV